jgi:hypothetical protein
VRALLLLAMARSKPGSFGPTFLSPDMVGRDGGREAEGPEGERAVVALPRLMWSGELARLLRFSVSMEEVA